MRSQSSAARDLDARPVPLGPDSLTWKYGGDNRGFFIALWSGAIQNMHPKLGAAVEEHSEFFKERWERLMRSVYPIVGVTFDGDRAPQTGAEVRDYHRNIKGVDRNGNRYHALDPDVFYWAHATFFMGIIIVAEKFGGGLTEAEKRQLFDEHVEWYRMYGVSMRPVPASWEDFLVYWDHMCRDVLEDNKATRDVLDVNGLPNPPFLPIPDLAWRHVVRPMVAVGYTWITVGLFDEPIRKRMGFKWSRTDELLFKGFAKLATVALAPVPVRYMKHPRALAGMDRAAGRIPADTPLLEAPRMFAPPIDEWDDPKHYNPYRAECPVHRGQRPIGTGSKS